MKEYPGESPFVRCDPDTNTESRNSMATDLSDCAPTDLPKLQASHEGEHHGDYSGNIPITRSTVVFAMCAAVNSVNLGYDIGISTSAGILVQDDMDLTLTQREIFIGSLNFWAMAGALFAQYCTDAYGRRRTFQLAALGFIIGCIIMAMSPGYTLLMIGRFFVGIGVGTGLAIDPLYISEVAPAKHRGELVTWSEISLNIGIVLGFVMSLLLAPMNDGTEWRAMFLVGTILPMVMLYLVKAVMPESPRWLVANGQEAEAKQILRRIYPADFNVDPVVKDIKEALSREAAAEKSVGWQTILAPSPAIRRMLMVGAGTAIAQQAVGIDAIQNYLLDVIKDTGIDSHKKETYVLIFLGIIKLVFIIVGGKLFDTRGRKPLLLASLLGMAGSLVLVSISFFVNGGSSAGFIVFGLALYLAFFSIGMGPGAWLIASEVFASSIRAKAMSVATFCNRATATLMSSTSLSVSKAIGWDGFFMLLVVVCLIVLVYLYFYLPETKGRSLEEMSIYFAEITNDRSILDVEAKIRGNRSIEMSAAPSSLSGGTGDNSPPVGNEIM